MKTLVILEEPGTVVDVSKELFGKVDGYNVLLALEEAGAHVEYLYQRGLLAIHNLDDLNNANQDIPVMYYRVDGEDPRTLLREDFPAM